MSGGSLDYVYGRLEDCATGKMHDPEMEDLLKDFVKVLHDLEWWLSSDTSEEDYRKTLRRFKKKWLRGNSVERLRPVIEDRVAEVRKELLDMLGA